MAENLFFPRYLEGKEVIDWKELSRQADSILRDAGMALDPQMKVRDLSVSERQLLLVIKVFLGGKCDLHCKILRSSFIEGAEPLHDFL